MQHLIQLLDFFMHKIMQLSDGLLANVKLPILTIQVIPTESNVQFYELLRVGCYIANDSVCAMLFM